jgi:ADP-heptose:LPS heptosyltransferase
MSTPILEVLRERLPDAKIEYLTYPFFAPALQGHPGCDRVLTMPSKAGPRATLAIAKELRNPRIDWFLDTLGNPRSAFLMSLSRPRHSVAPYRGFRSRLYEHSQRHEHGERSAVRHQLDTLSPLFGWVDERQPKLYVEDSEREDIASRLDIEAGEDIVVVHPGATKPERAWPVERWPSLIAELQHARPSVTVLVITQPGWDDEAIQIVGACSGNVSQLPALDLRSLMALISFAKLYVGNDGGILHAAVALQVPTVGIFGPTEDDVWFPYARWGPYRVCSAERAGQAVPARPDAEVDDVIGAVEEVWSWPG